MRNAVDPDRSITITSNEVGIRWSLRSISRTHLLSEHARMSHGGLHPIALVPDVMALELCLPVASHVFFPGRCWLRSACLVMTAFRGEEVLPVLAWVRAVAARVPVRTTTLCCNAAKAARVLARRVRVALHRRRARSYLNALENSAVVGCPPLCRVVRRLALRARALVLKIAAARGRLLYSRWN